MQLTRKDAKGAKTQSAVRFPLGVFAPFASLRKSNLPGKQELSALLYPVDPWNLSFLKAGSHSHTMSVLEVHS